jgi:hypothetical protein
MVDAALKELSSRFEAIYSRVGRPSIPPEKLLRALLLQIFCTIRSERLLMQQLEASKHRGEPARLPTLREARCEE